MWRQLSIWWPKRAYNHRMSRELASRYCTEGLASLNTFKTIVRVFLIRSVQRGFAGMVSRRSRLQSIVVQGDIKYRMYGGDTTAILQIFTKNNVLFLSQDLLNLLLQDKPMGAVSVFMDRNLSLPTFRDDFFFFAWCRRFACVVVLCVVALRDFFEWVFVEVFLKFWLLEFDVTFPSRFDVTSVINLVTKEGL